MELEPLVADYLSHIEFERNLSPNTVKQYSRDLGHWIEYLKAEGVPLETEAVDVTVIRGWLRDLNSRGISPVTVTRHLACVRSFFAFAVRFRDLVNNPAAAVLAPKTHERLPQVVTRGEVQKLLDACDGSYYQQYRSRDKCIIAVLASLGLRRQELIDLRLEDWDAPARTVLVASGKGRKARLLPLTDELIVLGQEWLNARPESDSDYFFLSRAGGPLRPTPLQRMLQRLSDDAGLAKRPHLHQFRHFAATSMVQNAQGGLEQARRLLGHRNLETLSVYTHLEVDDLRAALTNNGLGKATETMRRWVAGGLELDSTTQVAERLLRLEIEQLPVDWQTSEPILRAIVTEWTRQAVPEDGPPLLKQEIERILWDRGTVSRLSFDVHLAIAAFGGLVYRRMPEVAGRSLTSEHLRAMAEELVRGTGIAIQGSVWGTNGGEGDEVAARPRTQATGEILLEVFELARQLQPLESGPPMQRLIGEALTGLLVWSCGIPPPVTPATERPLKRLLMERVRVGDLLPMASYSIAKMRNVVSRLSEADLARRR